MASKRRLRKKSCGGKVGYESAHAGYLAMIALYRKDAKHLGFEKMNVYKCRFCKKYHIGHRKKKFQQF